MNLEFIFIYKLYFTYSFMISHKFFSRGTRSRFSTLAMNFVVMAYLSDKVRPILRLKLSCLSNKKNRASLDWIWIFGILILSDLGKLHWGMGGIFKSVRVRVFKQLAHRVTHRIHRFWLLTVKFFFRRFWCFLCHLRTYFALHFPPSGFIYPKSFSEIVFESTNLSLKKNLRFPSDFTIK